MYQSDVRGLLTGSGGAVRGLLSRAAIAALADAAARGEPAPAPSPAMPAPPMPNAPAPARSQTRGPGLLARTGRFADDLLFGGQYGRLRAERSARDAAQAGSAAHKAAYAGAMGPDGFDPEAYGRLMAEQGQAPSLQDIGGLEAVTDSQDVRGARGRQEQRGLLAGVVAPYAGPNARPIPEADLPEITALARAFGLDAPIPTTPGGVNAAVAAGVGADSWMQGDRQYQDLAESSRANRANEAYRGQALDFQRDESGQRLSLDRERFKADDAFRREQAATENALRRWELENVASRSDIEGQVLRKAIASGAASLTPEERAVYDRAVSVSQGGFGFGAPSVPGGPVGSAAPNATPQNPAPAPAQNRPAPAGDGRSPQSPARPQTQQDLDRLPNGAYFVDPGDGQLYQKEG